MALVTPTSATTVAVSLLLKVLHCASSAGSTVLLGKLHCGKVLAVFFDLTNCSCLRHWSFLSPIQQANALKEIQCTNPNHRRSSTQPNMQNFVQTSVTHLNSLF